MAIRRSFHGTFRRANQVSSIQTMPPEGKERSVTNMATKNRTNIDNAAIAAFFASSAVKALNTKENIEAEISAIKSGALGIKVSTVAIGRRIALLTTDAVLNLMGFTSERKIKGGTETVPSQEKLFAALEGAMSRAALFSAMALANFSDKTGLGDAELCGMRNQTAIGRIAQIVNKCNEAEVLERAKHLVMTIGADSPRVDCADAIERAKQFGESLKPEKKKQDGNKRRCNKDNTPRHTESEIKEAEANYKRLTDWTGAKDYFATLGLSAKHATAIKAYCERNSIEPYQFGDAFLKMLEKANTAPSAANVAESKQNAAGVVN